MKFSQAFEQIKKIELIDDYGEETERVAATLDSAAILEDLQKLPCRQFMTDPVEIMGKKVIYSTYQNGD